MNSQDDRAFIDTTIRKSRAKMPVPRAVVRKKGAYTKDRKVAKESAGACANVVQIVRSVPPTAAAKGESTRTTQILMARRERRKRVRRLKRETERDEEQRKRMERLKLTKEVNDQESEASGKGVLFFVRRTCESWF